MFFLNLSRTGGESVYHFRLPSILHRNEGLHTVIESHPRFQSIGSKNKIFTQTRQGSDNSTSLRRD